MRSIRSSKLVLDRQCSAQILDSQAIGEGNPNHKEFDCQEGSSCRVTTHFCRPNWYDAIYSTYTDSCNDTSTTFEVLAFRLPQRIFPLHSRSSVRGKWRAERIPGVTSRLAWERTYTSMQCFVQKPGEQHQEVPKETRRQQP